MGLFRRLKNRFTKVTPNELVSKVNELSKQYPNSGVQVNTKVNYADDEKYSISFSLYGKMPDAVHYKVEVSREKGSLTAGENEMIKGVVTVTESDKRRTYAVRVDRNGDIERITYEEKILEKGESTDLLEPLYNHAERLYNKVKDEIELRLPDMMHTILKSRVNL